MAEIGTGFLRIGKLVPRRGYIEGSSRKILVENLRKSEDWRIKIPRC